MIKTIHDDRRRFLGATVKAFAGVQLGVLGSVLHRMTPEDQPMAGSRELQALERATAWLNAAPLTAEDLRGRVVLIDFWTYTCINWMRTMPYVRTWAEKYKDHGLVVVGVHTPEFSFEHDLENVRRAAGDLRVEYPIAIDNDYAIWRAFDNHYWPALYVVDAKGMIRHHQFGEGGYEEAETMVRRLLADAGDGDPGQGFVPIEGRGVEAAADWDSLMTPETYLGYERSQNFASPGGARLGLRRTFAAPDRLGRNQWALAGDWTLQREAALLNQSNGRIAFSFHARDLHLVMGSAAHGSSVQFRVRLDGQEPGSAHGLDVDAQGNGSATEPRMYQLIRQPGPIADRRFEIEFYSAGVEAFSFTFG